MILNPYSEKPLVYPGTRLLQSDYGLQGVQLLDMDNPRRIWTVVGLFEPVRGRVLGGIRAKVEDQKGYLSFCNQRDLEVMLGLARGGDRCPWSGGFYVDDTDSEWAGFCCDDDDLLDDLFERELLKRAESQMGILSPPLDIERRVHIHHGYDVEERYVFLSDVDPETGFYPDTRFEVIERRWRRSERNRIKWDRI